MQPRSRLRSSVRVRSSLMSGVAALAVIAFDANPASAIGTGDVASTQNVSSVISSGGTTTITPSHDRSIVDWNAFDIDAGQTLQFVFPSGHSIALNRVSEGAATIDGSLSGCVGSCPNYGGNIWIYAADGILFGANARVNTGGLLATTSPMLTGDTDFLKDGPSGTNKFTFGPSLPGAGIAVQSGARINSSGGTLAFVSPVISTDSNSSITTPAGASTVHYRAVDSYRVQFQLEPGSDLDLLTFEVPSGDAEGSDSLTPITLRGDTNAGSVFIASVSKGSVMNALISAEGTIVANAAASDGGQIVLFGDSGVGIAVAGTLQGSDVRIEANAAATVSGTVVAKTSDGNGGSIVVTGETVILQDGSLLDASGNKGGLVLVGGDIHGGLIAAENFAAVPIETASVTKVSGGAQIRADGITGAGGNVVVWSDDLTAFQGSISATGNAGSGGFAEVSGSTLGFSGLVDLRSAQGGAGTLLLDPTDINIVDGAQCECFADGSFVGGVYTPGGQPSEIFATNLNNQLTTANVVIDTSSGGGAAGNISVDAPVTNVGHHEDVGDLTLIANGNITINADLEITDRSLTLNAGGAITHNAGEITAANIDFNAVSSIDVLLGASVTGGPSGVVYFEAETIAINGAVVAGEVYFPGGSLSDINTITVAGIVEGGKHVRFDATSSINVQEGGSVIAGTVGNITQGGPISFSAATITVNGTVTAQGAPNFAQDNPGGEVDFYGDSVTVGAGGSVNADLSVGFWAFGSETSTFISVLEGGSVNAGASVNGAVPQGGQVYFEAGTITVDGTVTAQGTVDFEEEYSGGLVHFYGDNIAVGGNVAAEESIKFFAFDNITVNEGGNVTAGQGDDVNSGANVSFDPDTIVIAGNVHADGNVQLEASESIDVLITGNIEANGNVQLEAGASIDVAGNIGAGQNASLELVDCECGSEAASFINVSGSVSAGTGGASGNLTLDARGPVQVADITLSGNLTATGTATLLSDGVILQEGGLITAGTLTGSSAGPTTLNTPEGNLINVLGSFSAGSEFSLTNGQNLTVQGPVGAGQLALTTLGEDSNLILSGDLSTQGSGSPQIVMLVSGGSISQNGGIITAGMLTGSSGGSAILGTPTAPIENEIGVLQAFSAGTHFSLTNAEALHVEGTDVAELGFTGVSAGDPNLSGDITLAAVDTDADSDTVLTLSTSTGFLDAVGDINLIAGRIDVANESLSLPSLDARRDVNLTADTIDFSSGTIDAGRDANLTGGTINARNAIIEAVGNASLSGNTVDIGNGTIDAGGNASISADALDITNATIIAGGDATIVSDTITVGETVQAGGNIDFVADTSIDVLATGTISAGQNASLALRDCQCSGGEPSINVSGNVTAGAGGASGDLTLDTSAAQSAANITLSGSLTAAGAATPQITMLRSSGEISQGGSGVITADILTGSSNGTTTLDNSNRIGELAAFGAETGFSLTNAQTLDVHGADVKQLGFTGISAGADLALTTTGASSDLILSGPDGALTAVDGTVVLNAVGDVSIGIDAQGIDAQSATITSETGAVVQNGGTIRATEVTISAGTDILIGELDFTNVVAGLAPGQINVALGSPPGGPSGTSHVFIDTASLVVQAPGKIVQQNTGTVADPDGIRVTSESPLIRIIGQPSVVDLFVRFTEGLVQLPPLLVPLSPLVVVDETNINRRINGCIIHGLCAATNPINLFTFPLTEMSFSFSSVTPPFGNITFPSSNEGPNALVSAITSPRFSDIVVVSDDDPDALGNDPTITGSGNEEISR